MGWGSSLPDNQLHSRSQCSYGFQRTRLSWADTKYALLSKGGESALLKILLLIFFLVWLFSLFLIWSEWQSYLKRDAWSTTGKRKNGTAWGKMTNLSFCLTQISLRDFRGLFDLFYRVNAGAWHWWCNGTSCWYWWKWCEYIRSSFLFLDVIMLWNISERFLMTGRGRRCRCRKRWWESA